VANLKLRLACWDYDRTRALIDGRVRPDGIDLDVSVMRPREAFTRMLERGEFDIAEVSLASYARLKAEGDNRFVGLPVALSRMFRHSCIYVRAGAGIRTPEDLRGRRVGAAQLDSTGAVFIKGMLAHDHGVTPDQVQWVVGGLEVPGQIDVPARGHGIVEILGSHESLNTAFESNHVDAMISNHIPSLFRRGDPQMVRLFPNYKVVEQSYYKRTGIFPIMHVVAIRADLHREDSSVAPRLYKAFCDARDLAISGLYDTDALRLTLPWLIDHVEEARNEIGQNYWAYGAKENSKAWNALCDYQVEQQLSPRNVGLAALFAAG
jgi:4,5-dihydroxyphthalate decarboxylase